MLRAMGATSLQEAGHRPAELDDDDHPGQARILMRRPFEVPLPRERSCSAIARRLVERHFALELDPDVVDDLKLVTTELVDNAYLHGTGEIRLRLQLRGGRVRVEVLHDGEGRAHVWADVATSS
jgi:anti-sigma regulatory factor (Ser/Thr protein kinase)